MGVWICLFLLTLPGFSQPVSAAEMRLELCPGRVLVGPEDPHLTDTEKRLVCGDPNSDSWSLIPESQALFHLRGFLQDRGFYNPTSRRDGKTIVFDMGQPSTVSDTVISGAPCALAAWDEQESRGERLTPQMLKSLAARAEEVLGSQGFACPRIETQADPVTGRVSLRVGNPRRQVWAKVEETPMPELAPETLRRYDSFLPGMPYSSEELRLSTQRVMESGVVRSAFFNIRCDGDRAIPAQRIFLGPPRELRLGVGFNTDRGALLRAQWTNLRLGTRASRISTSLETSYMGRDFNSQVASVSGDWYFLEPPSRFLMRPQMTFKHESNNRGETLNGEVSIAPVMRWDGQDIGYYVSLGPSLTGVRTLRGEGRKEAFFLALASEFRMTSHAYELNRLTPERGFELSATGSLHRKGFLADYTAESLRLRFTWLVPSHRYGNRKVIFGFRTGYSTTFVRDAEGGIANLTPNLRHYLGGTTNMRGFSVQEIPGDAGGLSAFFASLEARSQGHLPFLLQPYAFVDVGMVSSRPLSITDPWFLSPGVGLRWQSPVGVFRTSIAHGVHLSSRTAGAWRFHLSFGEEF